MSHKFTASFQNALGNTIEQLLVDWFGEDHYLEVGVEYKPTSDWNGRPDIWIGREGGPYSRILNIEIEHFSNEIQANQNINHVINWVSANQSRRASVLHLVNLECRLSDPQCKKLFTNGYENRSRRFGYDFRVYEALDRRASKQLAENFYKDYDFHSLLWQHLRFLRLI